MAGAKSDALIEDFQNAIDDAMNGMPFKGWLDKNDVYHPGFLDKFDEIVKKHGWDYNGGRNWRARVIYETNLKSAYSAGRYKQMNEPAVLKAFPFWEYVHGMERVPVEPRTEHVGWNGLILRADDIWWQTYYPPNGWKCGCGVRPVSKSKMRRLGKTEPDTAPTIEYEKRKDPATGDMMNYPKGVDLGWGYRPGRTWADGLIPTELQRPLTRQMEMPGLDNLTPLKDLAVPFKSAMLQPGQSDETYMAAFLKPFGAEIGKPKLFRDKAGQALVISDDLFRDRAGKSKISKRSRALHFEQLAETIMDPDEIWLNWVWHDKLNKWMLDRRYIRHNPKSGAAVIFEWMGSLWSGTTGFPAKTNQIERRRTGALLYRREK